MTIILLLFFILFHVIADTIYYLLIILIILRCRCQSCESLPAQILDLCTEIWLTIVLKDRQWHSVHKKGVLNYCFNYCYYFMLFFCFSVMLFCWMSSRVVVALSLVPIIFHLSCRRIRVEPVWDEHRESRS
jgi:hypothetical protein